MTPDEIRATLTLHGWEPIDIGHGLGYHKDKVALYFSYLLRRPVMTDDYKLYVTNESAPRPVSDKYIEELYLHMVQENLL